MSERQMFVLINRLWSDLHYPEFYWQVLALLLILATSWWLLFRLRRKERAYLDAHPGRAAERNALREFGAASLKRLAFPLLSLGLVLILRKSLAVLGWEHLSLLYLAGPLLVSWALVRIFVYVLRRVFPLGGLLTSFERVVTAVIWLAFVLDLTGLADPLIDMLEEIDFRVGKQTLNLWMVLHGTVTVCVTLLVALWIASLIESRLMAAQQLNANIREVLGRLAKAILSVVALLGSLSLVGIDVTALSVFSGALAVGLGFGLQKIASNYVSGFIILLDRSISLGNLVAVDDKTSGTVKKITTRYTVIRTLGGTDVIVPNEYLVSNIVRNLSFSDTRVRDAVRVQVAYDTDVEKVMRLMADIAARHARVMADPAPGASLVDFAESGITLEIGYWVADPEAGTGGIRSDISLAILKAFRESGIEIPYPQRAVRVIGTVAHTPKASAE